MRNLTDRELKCVEKFCKKYRIYLNPDSIKNGIILDIIRYAKRLKLKKDKGPNKNIKYPKFDIIMEGEPSKHSIFFKWIKWITAKEVKRPFIEKGI